jgi:hypothetical protein
MAAAMPARLRRPCGAGTATKRASNSARICRGKGIDHGGQRPRRVASFQQHRTGGRVVIEPADRAVAIPGPQTDWFAGILFVERLELQSGGRAVRADHWQHQRCHAVPGWTVWPQRPAVQDVRD